MALPLLTDSLQSALSVKRMCTKTTLNIFPVGWILFFKHQ